MPPGPDGGMLTAPAFALLLTGLVWTAATRLSLVSRSLFNPVLTSVVAVIGVLLLLDIDYSTYRDGVAILTTLLGPAIVALALPLYRNRRLVGANLPAILTATFGGCVAGVLATLAVATSMGLAPEIARAAAPKHATSAVSAALAAATGAPTALAAVLSVLTGVTGAVLAIPLLRLARIRDPLVTGVALGVTAHAIGTARAFEEDATTGSMAAVGMAVSAVVVPLVVAVATVAGAL